MLVWCKISFVDQEYLISCWVCRGEFDAVASVWCSCDPKDPSKLCPYCLHCFCGSSDDYKSRFWVSAPSNLLNERASLRKNKDRLGELLVRSQLLTVEDLLLTVEQQAETGQKLGQLLVNNHFINAEELDLFLQMQSLSLPSEFANEDVDLGMLERLNYEFCSERRILPLKIFRGANRSFLLLAMSNPRDTATIDIVNRKTDLRVVPLYSEENSVSGFLKKYIPSGVSPVVDDEARDYQSMIRSMILDAIRRHASDIHIEPDPNEIKIRYRIDGVLYRVKSAPKKDQAPLIAGFKKLAKMDLQNTRMPQSSKMVLKLADQTYQLNTLTFPSPQGESISIKIVNVSSFLKDLSEIGLLDEQLVALQSALEATAGLILVSGPLMNGVSTTEYAIMKHLAASNRKITSLESPIFAHVNNIHQSEINPSIGFDFLTGINSIIRSDPDVVILSDIPDSEVAASVCRISSRCVVVALMNAPSAAASIVLLREMGAAPSLLSQNLTLALNQRLIRKLCPSCFQESRVTEEELSQAGLSSVDVQGLNMRKAKGCKECNFIGYYGRMAIFESLILNYTIAEKILNASAADIEASAAGDGMLTLRSQCLQMIGDGITTLDEFQKLKL